MKQRITPEQLQELTPEQQERLRAWWQPQEGDWVAIEMEIVRLVDDECLCSYDIEQRNKEGYLPLLNIGQVFEIITQNVDMLFGTEQYEKIITKAFHPMNFPNNNGIHVDWECKSLPRPPIDILWEALKAVI